MSDQAQNDEIGSLVQEIFVLGFRVVGAEVSNLPDRVSKALEQAEVKAAIQNRPAD